MGGATTSREFIQRTHAVKAAASAAPVVITTRGRPTHVLMAYEEFQRLSGVRRSLADALTGPPELAEINFDPPKSRGPARPADFA
ncbi:MAG: type II toxin-antitoxin system Phd/YefM family antitoxin [Bifidobacteriaceae bacterium]|nr:type II toxin-antitoxin system Phd/YefM family antitoxin [Bifidobacteriaceae bacterium]